MSKSLGNYVTLEEVLPKYGAEVLRLWVAAEDYAQDIRLSAQILDRLADAYRRIRNTYRFLLGNLADFDPARDGQPYERLDEVDRFILDRLARLIGRVHRAYGEYQFHTAFHAVHNFCAVDLSALYLDIIKDRLYTWRPRIPAPRGADRLLRGPARAPAAHGAHPELHGGGGVAPAPRDTPTASTSTASPRCLLRGWTTPWSGSGAAFWRCGGRLPRPSRRRAWPAGWTRARPGASHRQRPGGDCADSRLPRGPAGSAPAQAGLLPTLFIVSQVTFEAAAEGSLVHHPSQDTPGLVIAVDRAPGRKCERCWRYTERVGEDPSTPPSASAASGSSGRS